MTEIIRLRTEPCSVCDKTFALGIPSNQLQPDVTGLDVFLDLHGLDHEVPHARILYVDEKGFVRTISVIKKFTTILREE
ncbi:MAG: hypothetical protein ACTSPV_08760 [Candidatus Hodarchaeales archaeon]